MQNLVLVDMFRACDRSAPLGTGVPGLPPRQVYGTMDFEVRGLNDSTAHSFVPSYPALCDYACPVGVCLPDAGH